jgi:hypothetical protein
VEEIHEQQLVGKWTVNLPQLVGLEGSAVVVVGRSGGNDTSGGDDRTDIDDDGRDGIGMRKSTFRESDSCNAAI